MKCIEHRITTRLTVAEIATGFRDGLRSRPHGVTGFVASKGLEWEFYQPDGQSDPFSQFDSDKPTFEVGATYGIRHARGPRITEFRSYIEATTGGAVELQVWDRATHRELLLRHGGDLSKASKIMVQAVVDLWRGADPSLSHQSAKARI